MTRSLTPKLKVCTCDTVYKVLPALGLAKPSTDPIAHMAEEEAWLLPHLPREVANRIRMEHEEFRAQKKIFGEIDIDQFEAHAKYEDEMVKKHLSHLLPGARAAGALRERMLDNRLSRGIERSRARTGATVDDGFDNRFLVLGAIGLGLIVASYAK